MSDQLQTILDLKTKAKNRRDRERYEIAVSTLDQAIGKAKEALTLPETTAARKSQFAEQLADCYGMQGGIYRRWGLDKKSDEYLVKSINAYDAGFGYESDGAYKIVDTYNLVNRLVGRLLFDSTWLAATPSAIPAGLQTLDMKAELEQAEKVIGEQLKLTRRGDIWALADLALVTILLNKDDPASAYADFHTKSPPDYAYKSALSTLQPLAKLEHLELAVKRNLDEAVTQLKSRLEKLQH